MSRLVFLRSKLFHFATHCLAVVSGCFDWRFSFAGEIHYAVTASAGTNGMLNSIKSSRRGFVATIRSSIQQSRPLAHCQ